MIQTASGRTYDLRHVDRGEWEHTVRDALRRAEWATAAGRRSDMRGIENGVDREVTLSLLSTGKLDHGQRGLLRCVLSGAI